MTAKQQQESELQKLITQVALLTERVTSLTSAVEKSNVDHEKRLRDLEAGHGVLSREIVTIRERMTVFNLLQSTLAVIAASLAYWLKK